MDLESVINAYQGVLSGFQFEKPKTFSEDFAQKRFLKKMEVPSSGKSKERKEACWATFLSTDNSLPSKIVLPSPEWYRARSLCHQALKASPFRNNFEGFGPGSSYEPTRGHNSVEARLSENKWTCTDDCFLDFAKIVYNTRPLKYAFRKRYDYWFRKGDFDMTRKESDSFLYRKFHSSVNCQSKDVSFAIFLWKLERVTDIVQGSRFSTVPKNNEKDRPINIEPFGNLVVQRSRGCHFREVMKQYFAVDLDNLQDVHRKKISSAKFATVDLTDASDCQSVALCDFLLPSYINGKLKDARSPFVLGLDRNYHILKKMSSMGNGFTFELMSFILLCLCRVLDPDSSVFGDDIIIRKEKAGRLIELLEEVGYKVNLKKTFIDGPFRESCGANYHDQEGYVESFDFFYPSTIVDCCHIYNKVLLLSQKYDSFETLRRTLLRFTPKALHGGPLFIKTNIGKDEESSADHTLSRPDDRPIENYFMIDGPGNRPDNKTMAKLKRIAAFYCYPTDSIRSFIGFEFVPKLRSKTVYRINPKRHWAKYLMYLHSTRVAKDTVTNSGSWVHERYFLIGSMVLRAKDLKKIS